jgi:hypothetical protein
MPRWIGCCNASLSLRIARLLGAGWRHLFSDLKPALRILVIMQPVPTLWPDPGRARYDPRFSVE